MSLNALKFLIDTVLNRIGYVKRSEIDQLRVQLDQSNRRLGHYIDYAASVYQYSGTYPNWKAQQEFRQMLHERPSVHCLQDPSPLNDYLAKLVDETKKLLATEQQEFLHWQSEPKLRQLGIRVANASTYFDESFLQAARGGPIANQ